MGIQCYKTADYAAVDKLEVWNDIVNSAYFPLSITSPQIERRRFRGEIKSANFGAVDITLTTSDAIVYRRDRYHVASENKDYFLVTFPEKAPTKFVQHGKEVVCRPGEFVLEGSQSPFEFSSRAYQQLRVMRVPGRALRDRMTCADDLTATCVTASQGSGALLLAFLNSAISCLDDLDAEQTRRIGEQLADLLVMALETSGQRVALLDSSAREAHLHRIRCYINQQLGDQQLSTKQIASHCGLSLRYLHEVFGSAGVTVSRWIRERRLEECHAALSNPLQPVRSISEIAYRWGFADQSHFCRSFKAKYGLTPRQVRDQALSSFQGH